MKIQSIFVSAFITISTVFVASSTAFAFCGVIQESAVGNTAARASQKAKDEVRQKVRNLRRQYGYKLKLENPNLACLGGAVAIDANGNEMVGKPSCTATVSFCVNP